MKTRFTLSAILALCSMLHAPCQIPQGFNYQAIARDGATGNPITNTTIKVKLSVLSDTTGFYGGTGGVYVWEEEHTNVKTNSFGMFNIVLGSPTATKVQGTAASFSAIDWSPANLFVGTKIAVSPAYVYKVMGSAKLWSVPYSLLADDISGSVKKLTVAGETDNLDEALFEVKNKYGRTVFAVYNEGIRAYVSDGDSKAKKGGFAIGSYDGTKGERDLFIVTTDSIRAYIYDDPLNKGVKGGFAIGGFDPTKALTKDYLLVSPDSVRIYLDNNPVKGVKGGFAIGSFDQTKAGMIDYMRVSDDSIRFYIKEPDKYNKGGFAIGGFSTGKAIIPQFLSVNYDKTVIQVNDSTAGFTLSNINTGEAQNFLRMNPINYRIGHQSGEKLNQLMAKYNTFIGYQTGYNATDGRENLFIGYQAGYNTTAASYNVYMGTESGKSNVLGTSNVFIGFGSGRASTTSNNTYIGMKAGYANGPGVGNTYIGYCSGVDDGRPSYTGGSYNTFLGFNSGAKNYTGSQNVYLGAEASGNARGSGRVFIGYKAGYSTFGDSLLVIENHASLTPLVYGEFGNDLFRIYGTLQYTVGFGAYSDASLKTDIIPLSSTLQSLLSLKPCTFRWKEGSLYDHKMPQERQIGLIAQDVEKVFPELVSETSDGYKTLDYTKLGVLIIPALDELNSIIRQKDSEIDMLKSEISEIRSKLNDLEKAISVLSSNN